MILSTNTHETLCRIKDFICQLYDSVYSDFYTIYKICDSYLNKLKFLFFVSLTFHVLLILLQFFLASLQIISNFDILAPQPRLISWQKWCFKWLQFTWLGCCAADICLKSLSKIDKIWLFQLDLLANQTISQNFTDNCVYLTLAQLL